MQNLHISWQAAQFSVSEMLRTKNIHLFLQCVLSILCFASLCLSSNTGPITSHSPLKTDLYIDKITRHSPLRYPHAIESPGRVFRLGFFSPANSTSYYLGIFYTVSQETVIWVANRNRPLNDSSSYVTISPQGNLVLRNDLGETFWSTNITGSSHSRRITTAQIQDNGNLLLKDISTGNVLWKSFLHPSDVFVPTMRLVHNTILDTKVSLSSWRNPSDPGVGNFTVGLEVRNLTQIFTWNNGRPHWRSGPWNGQILIGVQEMYSPYNEGFSVGRDSGTFYFTAPQGRRFLMKIAINSTGNLVKSLWSEQQQSWDATWVAPQNECDRYATCGPFGSCNALESPICSCLRGFVPVNPDEWDMGNWTSGCVRRMELQCENANNNSTGGDGDGFLRLPFTKVPDFGEQFSSRLVDECRTRCLSNCSCIAYAHEPNIGCMFWSETLVDVQRFAAAGIDFYIRLPVSELDDPQDRRLVIIIPVVVGGFAVICMSILIAWCLMFKREGRNAKARKVYEAEHAFPLDSTTIALKDENIEELPLFTFETLANATDQFSESNLLGKGGFGPVYKGVLANGKEIGVKRLSAASGQGNKEFMNEVVVISKLQHRNLVKLLGCCVERGEKMLIYEFMPNKSLDGCLFDPTHPSQRILDWRKRFGIIEGIGRGILYLQRDSRLKIIHRDLKPSNVLLDEDWNPKISDFGMARIFGGNEEQLNTARVVGTYGYMAPEYAMEGRFSEKSDVYSFGVLMLEILSGKKNTHYYNEELSLSLLGCAWKLWNEDKGLSFMDQTISSPSIKEDIVRCINISLLCVQEFPEDRPAIQTVLAMLSCEIVDLPKPDEPVFAERWNRSQVGTTQQRSSQFGHSVNELTLTVLDGR